MSPKVNKSANIDYVKSLISGNNFIIKNKSSRISSDEADAAILALWQYHNIFNNLLLNGKNPDKWKFVYKKSILS